MFKPNLACEAVGPVEFPKLASIKLDGIRVITKFGGALTRSLKPVPNLHIREMLSKYQSLDGEVIVGSPSAPDCYRATNSAVMSHEGEPEFVFYVFDDLSGAGTYAERLARLKARDLPSFIQVLDQTLIESQAQLDAYYSDSLEQGFEGAILRNTGAEYKYGRSTAKSQDMLKMKPFSDAEAVVLSAYEAMANENEAFTNELGQTDRSTHAAGLTGKGMVGGFVCRDLKTGLEFKCAPGKLTHAERTELWDSVVSGRILKYRSMAYGVKDAPRFARFIGWRSALDM
jgi:DNA ligase-1